MMPLETSFGIFRNIEIVNLQLAEDLLSNKSLIVFNPVISKFDFKLLLEQIKNNGIKIYWSQTKVDPNDYHLHHLAIVDKNDVNFIKLIAENIKEYESNKLFEEISIK